MQPTLGCSVVRAVRLPHAPWITSLLLGCNLTVDGAEGFAEGGANDGAIGTGASSVGSAGDGDAAEPDAGHHSGDSDDATPTDTASADGTGEAGSTAGDGDGDGATTEAGDDAGPGSSGAGAESGTAGDTGGEGSDTASAGSDPCGFALDGPWVEVEYSQAGASATSPSWSYSATPGWGESQWAAQGESWPEVWDVYNNIEVDTDPIGVLATVGGSGTWQMMIGLQDLAGYDHATVCVEGRSVSASASVQFDVYNPLNDCGDSTTMAHDWSVHAEGIDLGSCLVPGGGVQAVRIETSGGSGALGIKRVTVALHGAVY